MPDSSLFRRYWPGTLLVSLVLSGCTQLALLTANARASFGEYETDSDLRYGQQLRQQLDIYRPKPSGTPGLRPVVLFIHGGGWDSGDKSQYRFVGAALAEQGWLAVVPNYSLYPRAKFPAFIDDAAQAIVWAHAHAAHYGGDPQRIYLVGHSAGGQIAALVTLDSHYLKQAGGDPTWIAGMVGLAGPYDFIPFTRRYMFDLFGEPADYPRSQPVNYVRADAPPMLLLHGLKDRTVNPRNTLSLSTALHNVGARAQAAYYFNVDHGDIVGAFSPLARARAPVVEVISQFINAGEFPNTDAAHREAVAKALAALPP